MQDRTYLGVELGSTRIKAVTIDDAYRPVASGGYVWKSALRDGIWTYDLDEAWRGLKAAIAEIPDREAICAAGISGMMHGYLAFDREWRLLTPFRTWQNTITAEAAERLTACFGFNIPQRWSVAHLYQAILNGEAHVPQIAHITTLAGYMHYMLTGVNAVGIGEASGMFPIDSRTMDYDRAMLEKFDALIAELPFTARDVLPKVLCAGADAGCLSARGAELLEHMLPEGLPFAPPEGDAGTGMAATNAVAPRTGNISAGTSIFAMLVLERPLQRVYPEIDMVCTPSGSPVAMAHANNCTADMNAWAGVLRESAALFGAEVSDDALYTRLYQTALEGEPDCGGLIVCNYLAGEGVTHLDAGCPMVLRKPDSRLTLANFFRAQLYAAMATLRLGMDLLAEEHIALDVLMGHGGLFKTPVVGQRLMAAACGVPVSCMKTAGEGGPYGMALLTAYRMERAGTLEEFLAHRVFADAEVQTIAPDTRDAAGFEAYLRRFVRALDVERTAVERL